MPEVDLRIGYQIARTKSCDETVKVFRCTESIAALLMQSHLIGTGASRKAENVTTVVVDEAHMSTQSDYTIALILLDRQNLNSIRLVVVSATGDHDLVKKRTRRCNKRTPRSQRLVMKGTMRKAKRIFLQDPMLRNQNAPFRLAPLIIDRHSKQQANHLSQVPARGRMGGFTKEITS